MPNTMLPIDRRDFPTLPQRRALLVIDCQNDFIADDGPLRATDPEDFVDRIVDLASVFRPGGDVIWVRTEYSARQIHRDDEIIASNAPVGRQRARGRSRKEAPEATDPEAFLGVEGPIGKLCARKGTPGAEFPGKIQTAVQGNDKMFVKSHYSAFRSGELLGLLRMRFVTELYICGSLFNIGVFATAVDAAGHGYEITLVDDCCGYRSPMRHSLARKKVEELTGCNIVNLDAALKTIDPEAAAERARQQTSDEEDKSDGSDDVLRPEEALGADDGGTSSKGKATTTESQDKPASPEAISKGANDKSQDILASSMSKLKLEGEEAAAVKARGPTAPGGNAAQPQSGAPADSTEFGAKPPASNTATSTSDEHSIPSSDGDDSTNDEGTRQAPSTEGQKAITSPDSRPSAESHAELETGINKLSLADKEQKGDASTRPNPRTEIQDHTQRETHLMRPNTGVTSSSSLKTSSSASNTLTQTPGRMASGNSGATTESICEGDTRIIHNLLPASVEDGVFEKLKAEVDWAKMSHQGGEVPRLVAVQGEVDEDGNQPIYRHPSDESPPLNPFTPTVGAIKEAAEKHLNHPLNHVLIQWYRDGHDYISEHSDKTLDITPESFIANVSLGAQRTMVLRTKKQDKKHAPDNEKEVTQSTSDTHAEGARRQAVRVPMPHNSLLKMGLQTNMRWLHGIRQDKRANREKTEAELSFGGARISLTFRRIGTYMDKTGKLIWGQGATGKTRAEAHEVINGQTPEAVRMLKAFGTENHSSDFDWEQSYGGGFDVLHMYTAARLFMSHDATVNNRVQLMLAELGISYARGSMSPSTDKDASQDNSALLPTGTPIMFVDNDDDRTVVEDEMAIMGYLDQVYGDKLREGNTRTNTQLAQELHRFHHAFHMCRWWRDVCSKDENKNTRLGKLRKALAKFDAYLASTEKDAFLCGAQMTVADFAFFATLHEIVLDGRSGGLGILSTFGKLRSYYDRMRQRDGSVMVLGNAPVEQKALKKPQAKVEEKIDSSD